MIRIACHVAEAGAFVPHIAAIQRAINPATCIEINPQPFTTGFRLTIFALEIPYLKSWLDVYGSGHTEFIILAEGEITLPDGITAIVTTQEQLTEVVKQRLRGG